MPEEMPREGMRGKFNHTLDAKGRLFVPAKLREALGDTFFVTVGVDHCLAVYPVAKWQTIEASLNAVRMSQAKLVRFIYANLAKCEPDKQGRFLLPSVLRDYAHIKDEVTFLGQGDHAEIWNTADYEAAENEFFAETDLAQVFKELEI